MADLPQQPLPPGDLGGREPVELVRSGGGRVAKPVELGALTHCAGSRAAAVARHTDLASVGIDAEPSGPLPERVARIALRAAEQSMIERLAARTPEVPWDCLLFSAKESVYKACFPLTQRWLGFEEAELTVDPEQSAFRARILIDGDRTDGGPPLTELAGRFLVHDGLLLTAVTVPQQDDL